MMLSRREEKQLRALRQRRNREAEGCFLAEGVRVVEELLRSPLPIRLVVHSSSLEDTERGRQLAAELVRLGVRRARLTDGDLAAFADTRTPQGVLAVAEIPGGGLERIQLGARRAVLLLLDAVQDPGNFGTLVRSAEALGAAGVIALPGTTDPWSPKAVRSAAGSSFRLPVLASDWPELDPWFRGHGCRILAAAAGGEPLVAARAGCAALVVGNEGAGVTAETLARADRTVGIPLRGRAESLNVAAAATLLLYELLR